MSEENANVSDDDWIALLAPERLETFLRERLGGDAKLAITGRAQSGSSNITAFLDFGGERLVLRRPPKGELLPTSHDMIREARFLEVFRDEAVPVARLRTWCEDKSVIGAPFHVTDEVDGLVLQQEEPALLRDPQNLTALCEHVIECLAGIHAVNWEGRGLPGRADGYLKRQIARWISQLELTPSAKRLKGIERVTQWLKEHLPVQRETTIVHGDYGFHNMILDRAQPQARAILDWEMATLGDPLADLAWFLQGWGQFTPGAGNPANYITTWSGCCSRDEMLELYARRTGRTLDDEMFYRVFSMWKGIIVTEGLYSAYLQGEAANPTVVRFKTELPERVEATMQLIQQ